VRAGRSGVEQLRQVPINLLLNAVQAAPPGTEPPGDRLQRSKLA
jgi:hypothetical protein